MTSSHGERVRVGIDATTWWNDRGFGRFTRELVRALCRRSGRFEYTLVVDRHDVDELPSEAKVEVVDTGKRVTESLVRDGSRSVGDMLALGRAVARLEVDVFFFPAVYSYFPLLRRVPSVVAFHDTIPERFPELVFPTRRNRWLWNAKATLARWQATRIMTMSEASASDLERFLGVPRARIDLVSEAAEPAFRVLDDEGEVRAVRTRFALPSEGPLLTYVGGLNPHKNLLRLLEAFERVCAARGDVSLVIVGDVSKRGFHDNVDELVDTVERSETLSQRVRFTGYVSDDELVALYNASYALVFPSLWEGFGLPAIEAMACGVPVVASDRSSLPEVIGDAGLYFDPTSVESIATVVLRIVGDPSLRAELATRALARANTYTWDRGAELAEASFDRCLRVGRGEGRAS